MKVRIVFGIIVFVIVVGIFFLTFQTPEQTTALSERVRLYLKKVGWEMTSKEIRSNVHIPIYFLFGLAIFIFGQAMGWKWYVSLLVAMSIALLDEGVKMVLPTREFDYRDLLKDFLGICFAFFISIGLKKIVRFKSSSR